MAPQIAGPPADVAYAYTWLEVARRRPPLRDERALEDDEERRRTVRGVLTALVEALERAVPTDLGHAERVAKLSRHLALAVGLPFDEAELVGQAGLLHDIGKLSATSRRGEEQPYWLHHHPIVGAQLVAPFEFLTLAVPMIRHHHERLDGSGYPDGLGGRAIPIGARIIAVADEYDRLRAGGACEAALTPQGALGKLAPEGGRTLDSTVVWALIDRPLP